MTSSELTKILEESGKSEDQINEIIKKFESRQVSVRKPKTNYNELVEILGINDLSEVRYFQFLNITACVIRVDGDTKVSFSFKNPSDFEPGYEVEDNIVLTPISPRSDYKGCYYASMNSKDEKFTVRLPGYRSSYTSVYEAWTYLCRNKMISSKYRKINIKILAFVEV